MHGYTMAAELLAIYDVGCYYFFCSGFSSPIFSLAEVFRVRFFPVGMSWPHALKP